ncbi:MULTISPECIES: hypothetical protein [unclassified Campylobacter]|uniref:hypothetical protein n=1 Tax=unclassified Campylobacter TaxID=2593542 RepID=UPI00147553D8|nr:MULTISPECIES: hypothetical protein [unclassified Campylobacter]
MALNDYSMAIYYFGNAILKGTENIEWLRKNDYISLERYGGDKSVLNAILTAKGLIVLNQTPSNLKESETILTKLKKAVSISSEEAIKSVTNSILSLAVGALK